MYPAGDERVIVRETLGVILKPGQLPLEAKCYYLECRNKLNV